MLERPSQPTNQQQYIWDLIQRTKNQDEDVVEAVTNNLHYNAFALLPENVLYSMLKCEDIDVRENALKKIISIREKDENQKTAEQNPRNQL